MRKQKIKEQLTKKEVNLNQLIMGDGDVLYIGKSSIKHVTVMHLSYNRITNQGMKHLSKLNWQNLTSIDLGGNYIKNDSCKLIANVSFSKLIVLRLENNQIDDEGVKHLSLCRCKQLERIYLGKNNLGDACIKYLSKGHWTKLTTVGLDKNYISFQNAKQLLNFESQKIGQLYIHWSLIQPYEQPFLRTTMQQKFKESQNGQIAF